jgi:histidine triad (HIT) family protein
MEDCIFCKIIKNELPSDKIYEDANFLAFLTIEPVSEGHILIVPKKHIVWMQDADEETVAEIFKIAKKLMGTLKNVTKADYVQLGISGEEIPHFHIHLFSRYYNDGLLRFPHKKYKEGEKYAMAQKIIAEL